MGRTREEVELQGTTSRSSYAWMPNRPLAAGLLSPVAKELQVVLCPQKAPCCAWTSKFVREKLVLNAWDLLQRTQSRMLQWDFLELRQRVLVDWVCLMSDSTI